MGDFEKNAKLVRERKSQIEDLNKREAAEDLQQKCAISITTTMIGALEDVEKNLGSMWGHGKNEKDLNAEEKRNRAIWKQIRQSILDRGNQATEKASYHFSRFDINYKTSNKKYQYTFDKLNFNHRETE